MELQPEEGSTLMRVQDQPGEVMRVSRRLWEISQLRAEVYQERIVLPGGEEFPRTWGVSRELTPVRTVSRQASIDRPLVVRQTNSASLTSRLVET